MERVKTQTKAILMVVGIVMVVTAIIVGFLAATGEFELYRLGNGSIFLGIACILLGLFLVNFRRTPVDIHVRFQGSTKEKRRRLKNDLGEFSRVFLFFLAGIIFIIIGAAILLFTP